MGSLARGTGSSTENAAERMAARFPGRFRAVSAPGRAELAAAIRWSYYEGRALRHRPRFKATQNRLLVLIGGSAMLVAFGFRATADLKSQFRRYLWIGSRAAMWLSGVGGGRVPGPFQMSDMRGAWMVRWITLTFKLARRLLRRAQMSTKLTLLSAQRRQLGSQHCRGKESGCSRLPRCKRKS